ncbi:hypothetical protein MEC_00479 [Bartonella alsatica IBS 382]|uniref:Uncharacterized protein n=1 Tax=Bartonella alsatica IBS 382 TaxID=1094551 RepID=J0Q097_9HYPH|nr:hypothetical protein MEC_00479 [Bartonella alsatica IBS 382]
MRGEVCRAFYIFMPEVPIKNFSSLHYVVW